MIECTSNYFVQAAFHHQMLLVSCGNGQCVHTLNTSHYTTHVVYSFFYFILYYIASVLQFSLQVTLIVTFFHVSHHSKVILVILYHPNVCSTLVKTPKQTFNFSQNPFRAKALCKVVIPHFFIVLVRLLNQKEWSLGCFSSGFSKYFFLDFGDF